MENKEIEKKIQNTVSNMDELFEEYDIEFEDITEKFDSLAKTLVGTPSEVILSNTFMLKDSSSDIEIGDPRTDIRAVTKFKHPEVIIEETEIKRPKDLDLEEVCAIYDQIFIRENSWLNGLNLTHVFYDFVYIHDEELINEHPYIQKLVKYSHSSMKKVMEYVLLMGERGLSKLDDFAISTIHFLSESIPDGEADAQMLELMKEFKPKIKKIKSKKKENFPA